MSAAWHFSRNGQSEGPISSDQLKQMAAAGELAPADMIWKDGMADWVPASKIKGLFGGGVTTAVRPATAAQRVAAAPAPQDGEIDVAPVAEPASQIGYFSNASGISARTAAVLKGYAAATGDRGDWPLNDQQLVDFQLTEKYRKKIRNAAGLYRLLFALMIIALVIVVIAGFAAMGSGGGAALIGLVTAFAVMGGITVLYYFAAEGTKKCHRWAPLTMFILFMIGVVLQGIGMILIIASSDRDTGAALFGSVIGMLFPIAFAVSSWQAFSAIPKFLGSPMWCQEALVGSKL
jgi:hypothetical protein